MADVMDILELDRMGVPELTREKILNASAGALKKKYPQAKAVRRPEGMHREVFALLYNDNKDVAPLMPTDTGYGYVPTKARLGMRQARFWAWTPFSNPGRTDGAVFHHWRRVSDESKEYPFAKFNKQLTLPTYSESDFVAHLRQPAVLGAVVGSNGWGKQETDHLFDLARRFDLRFVVMADRWDRASFPERSVEDLKERYYEVCGILAKLKSGEKTRVYSYDAEHERKRKEQLRKLFDRTEEQVKEEEQLQSEMKKIDARKKERERKTQDLQKLISQADQQGDMAGGHGISHRSRGQDRKVARKRVHLQHRPSRMDTSIVEGTGIKFPDLRSCGVSLRSQRMKLPANVGQKKVKALEGLLAEYNIELNPIPSEEVCLHFNELRSDMVLMCELRAALTTCEFEMQSLRHQYEAQRPGMTLTIPAIFIQAPEAPATPKIPTSTTTTLQQNIIDVVGSPIQNATIMSLH